MAWFYEAPLALSATVVVASMIALAVGAHLGLRHTARSYDFAQNNSTVGTVLSVVGIVYAVVLGFVVVIVWQSYYRSEQTMFDEVNAVADMYRNAPMLGEPLASRVRADLRGYVQLQLDEELPAMEHGRAGILTERQSARLVDDMVRTFASDRGANAARERELNLLQRVLDARRESLYVNAGEVPRPLWFTLVTGSALVLGMTFLLGGTDQRVHLTLTAAGAAMIGIMFVLILYLDAPFRGTHSTARYWGALLSTMQRHDL